MGMQILFMKMPSSAFSTPDGRVSAEVVGYPGTAQSDTPTLSVSIVPKTPAVEEPPAEELVEEAPPEASE